VRSYGADETVFVDVGAVHRLENPTDDPVAILEIQIGDYLGEDDIVRLEDRYNRVAR
jgi:mannose-6-phosphate isomerase-like protein (cupin superfamily)